MGVVLQNVFPHASANSAAAMPTFSLTKGQTSALQAIEAARIAPDITQFTLLGYPGTGKTTIISHYANLLRQRGISVIVSAPTNKATRVLMKKIGRDSGIEFASIQSLLGLRMDEKEDGTQDCIRKSDSRIAQYRVVIVDECSMVSSHLFQEICQYQGNAFVIFVGDPYQLPPVESDRGETSPHARISQAFVERPHWAKFTLSEVVRQAADNPIIGLATAIRETEIQQQRFTTRMIHDYVIAANDPRLFVIQQAHVPVLCEDLIIQARAQGREDLPVRIVAWRNQRVQQYNLQMHQAIGSANTPEGAYFAPGESALAHQEFDGLVLAHTQMYDPNLKKSVSQRMIIDHKRIIISEEGIVTDIHRGNHPAHPDVDSWEIAFLPEDEQEPVFAYVPVDPQAFRAKLEDAWRTYRDLRKQRDDLARKLDILKKDNSPASAVPFVQTQNALKQASGQTSAASQYAWSLQKSHGKIRHAYASTAHKAQGSTWDTTIVDLSDLSQMPDDRDYNRALYVAVTRSSGSLAIAL